MSKPCPEAPRDAGAEHVAIVCLVPRSAGAAAAMALADQVCALFRDRAVGTIRVGAPAVELDGRDPDGFRAVVTLPLRRLPAIGGTP